MTAMVHDFDGVRELSMEEVDAVAGAAGPLAYYAVRAGFGAALGATGAALSEAQGDGLSWEDWDEIATGAGLGSIGGLGFGKIAKSFPAD